MSNLGSSHPTEVRLRDPLTDVSRKERRALLGISAIGIIVAKTGLVPSKISTLGIDFSLTDQTMLFRALAGVIGYFLIAFVLYAASDFIAWRVAWMNALREATRARYERERGDVPFDLHRTVEEEVRHRFGSVRIWAFSAPVSSLRALFDFIIPVFIGIWAIAATLSAHPPPPSPATPLPVVIATPNATPPPTPTPGTPKSVTP